MRTLAVIFVSCLLFSTLWAAPIKFPKQRSAIARNLFQKIRTVSAPALGGAITCDGCQLVVAWAESQLSNNNTESEIETFLNTTVCEHIPAVVRAECENIVDAYFPELVALLLSRENPTTACTQLKLCSSQVKNK